MEWATKNIETILAVVAFLLAGWKARKAGTLNGFLVSKIEGLANPEDKAAIKADAIKAGVEKVLAPVVKKVTKGEGGGVMGLVKGLLPLLLVATLAGCALADPGAAKGSADAGAAVTVRIEVKDTRGPVVIVETGDRFASPAGTGIAEGGAVTGDTGATNAPTVSPTLSPK